MTAHQVEVVLTDIEGTTSSIDFVHQTLFPYARQRLRDWLRANAHQDEVHIQLDAVEQIVGGDLSLGDAADVLERWIDEDRKATPLKALQGMIWAEGYAKGELQGHVYPDTPEVLRQWHADGLGLYVYSSGSVAAQKLIFGHTPYGDLTPLFSGYFDTRVGGKREAESYRKIIDAVGCAPEEMLFLSDVGAELDAAREAGVQTWQIVRDDKTLVAAGHRQAVSLLEVRF